MSTQEDRLRAVEPFREPFGETAGRANRSSRLLKIKGFTGQSAYCMRRRFLHIMP